MTQHENPNSQNPSHLEPVQEPTIAEPTEVKPLVGEISPDDPRFDLLAKLAETTFPELENMSPDDKVRLMFGGVGWRLLDPEGEIPDAKKEAITDWSANALIDVLPQGSLRDEKGLADKMAGAHPVLHEERRSHTEQARTDSLTGLGSELAFIDYAKSLEETSEDEPVPKLADKAIVFVDTIGLKKANDVLSQAVGDYVMKFESNVFPRARKVLFDPSDLRGGGERGPKEFRKSGGADDIVIVVPKERAQEYARFIQEEAFKPTGEELDLQNRDDDGSPTKLETPNGVEIQHRYENNGLYGLSNTVGSLKIAKGDNSVTVGVAVGVATLEDIDLPDDGDYTGSVNQLVELAFDRMKTNKDRIKTAFPHFSFRED